METFKKALSYAFLLLKYRVRTFKEIRDRLKAKKFSPPAIESVLKFLDDNGYLNDRVFASIYVKDKLHKGWGLRRVIFELRRLGVGDEEIEEVVSSVDPGSYRESITKLIARCQRRYPDDARRRGRIIRYLSGRGFDMKEIIEAMNENR